MCQTRAGESGSWFGIAPNEAKSIARLLPFDLILMDIQLPVMDEATHRIRAIPELAQVPIVAVTSYALSGDKAKTREAVCNGYIAKPFSPRQLFARCPAPGDITRQRPSRPIRQPGAGRAEPCG
jgi:CheY-like chemotaxis protein